MRSCDREPGHQLALRRADPPLPLHRRGHHQRDRRRPPDQLLLRPHRPAPEEGRQAASFDTEWTQDRIEENKLINQIRAPRRPVAAGRLSSASRPPRAACWPTGPTPTARRSSSSARSRPWRPPSTSPRSRSKYGDAWIENALREANDTSNPGLPRIAFKMATGSGKTVVMAMLIAWHTLNKLANPQDARFSDTFLIVTPGITIRDRLRVLLPNDPQNYYRQRDIVPAQQLEQLGQAKILITNFHAFQLREKVAAGKLTKSILAEGETERLHRDARPDGAPRLPRAGQQEEHHRHQRRGPPLLPPQARRRGREAHRRRPHRGQAARRRGPRLDLRPRGGQGQDRRQGHLRPLGHAVLPARLRLPRRHALPLGRLRLLADRRHRGRHRQGAARAGGRRLDDRRAAHLPRPVAAHPRGPAQEGPQDRRRRRRAQAARRAAGRAAQPLRQLREVLPPVGAERRGPRPRASRRRSSSSSATTPTSPSWSSTTSPAGRSRSASRPSSRPGNCPSSATTTATAAGCTAPTRSWSTASSSNPARR